MKRNYLITFISCLLTLFFVFTYSLAIAEPNNPAQSQLCSQLTGPALGLCTAAVAIECDKLENSLTKPCQEIAIKYEEETGEALTWIPICPCYSTKDLNDLFIDNPTECHPTSCIDDFDPDAGEVYTTTEWLNELYDCDVVQVSVWTWGLPENPDYIECHIGGPGIQGYDITIGVSKEESLACSAAIKDSILWSFCSQL